jgi:L-ascorbate metabolism protein UlaG (beta-lactamase superfamily)
VLLCALLAAACTRGFVPQGPVLLAVDQAPDARALYVQWLGVSSWIISHGPDVVVVDPFFSRPSVLTVAVSLAFPRLAPNFGYDPERIGDVLPDLPRGTGLVLVGHGHYDHLMDVGYYVKRTSGQGVRYVGSATIRNILLGFQPASLDFWTAERGGSTVRGRIRVTAFPSDHAPQVDGLHFMTGEWAEAMPSAPTAAGEYREGETHVYLVDFLDAAGAIRWRVFVNGSASSPAGARALAERPDILRQARTNVAILCVPGWDKVPDYPDSILRLIDPDHVVLSHFDNFFAPYRNGEDPARGMEFVPFAHYGAFVGRLEALRRERGYRFELHQPRTGQCFGFPRPAGALACER